MSALSTMDDVRHVRIAQAAAMSGIGVSTVRRLIDEGAVESRRIGRTVLVNVASLAAMLRNAPSAAAPRPDDPDPVELHRLADDGGPPAD